jgi:hypothetical protein
MSTITVLHHARAFLVKTWLPDGTINAYDHAKHFSVEAVPLSGMADLSQLLTRLESNPHAGIIRGTYTGNEPVGWVTRVGVHFDDLPIHPILIEVDGFEPLSADPVTDPMACIHEYIISVLPKVFHDASYHWQLSNSAGHLKHSGTLKAHLWFWLRTPYSSAQLKHWAKAVRVDCDHAVFNKVQIHYTGAPLFEEGLSDPVPVRSGDVKGLVDAVPLVIDPAVLEVATASVRLPRQLLEGERPTDDVVRFLNEKGLVLDRTADRVHVQCPWASGHSTGTPGDTSSSWLQAGSGNHECGHFKCLHDSCSNRTDRDFLDAVGYMVDGFDDLTLTPDGTAIVSAAPEWPHFVRSDKGQIKPLIRNVVAMLARPDLTGMPIRYDAFRDEVLLGHLPFTDVHYTRLRLRLESPTLNFAPVGREMIRDAVLAVALDATFDSAQDWLNGLVWDGVERIERFYTRYLGTEDTPYTRAVSLYHLTAHAGRVLSPGCQVDMVPVLIGPQGSGKSSAIRALVPAELYYVELSLAADDDDLARMVKGVLAAEIPELRGLRGKEIDHIKAYITKREEEYIPKYMEKKARYPRRVVFTGTTNQEEFLADETGNRRWLPVMVGRQDISAIERDRLQLWAEARDRVKLDGIQWRGAEELGRSQHIHHMAHDPWETSIVKWLHTPEDSKGITPAARNCLQTAKIFQEALVIEPRNRTKGDEMRIAAILRGLGYRPVRESIEGERVRVWKANLDHLQT